MDSVRKDPPSKDDALPNVHAYPMVLDPGGKSSLLCPLLGKRTAPSYPKDLYPDVSGMPEEDFRTILHAHGLAGRRIEM
jgi:hypothetical protein